MSKTVMLVDDEEVVLDIAQKKMKQQGYEVLTAGNGEEALEVLSENPAPDLIVLDIEMPKMNGYTFLTEFKKKNGGTNPVPIIVLTAYDAMEPIFKRHGVRAYLLKPLKFESLLDQIKEIIG